MELTSERRQKIIARYEELERSILAEMEQWYSDKTLPLKADDIRAEHESFTIRVGSFAREVVDAYASFGGVGVPYAVVTGFAGDEEHPIPVLALRFFFDSSSEMGAL